MRVNREELYGQQFIKAEDIKDGQKLTIEKVEFVSSDLKKGGKTLCLFFKGFDHPLSLNATNFDYMCEKYGDDTDKWVSKTLTARKPKVENFKTGKEVDAIRFA